LSFYSQILEGALVPGYYRLKGRGYGGYRAFLEKSQWWPAERLREFQWRELRRLLEVAFHHVPFYRRKYESAGARLEDIRSLEDFARLPVLRREEVVQPREQMRSQAWRGRLILHATGGSSGRPARFYITLDSYDWRCAASARAYSWSGCRLGERTLYLWGGPVGEVSRGQAAKMGLFRWIRRELMINTFSQSEALWAGVRRRALRFRPRFVVGYVSSLEQFSRYLLDKRLSFPAPRAVIAAAEPLAAPTRETIERALGAPVYNTYGSREFMSIAAECERREGLHIHMENLLVETAEGAGQGPSKLLITDLHNLGMPFIRYEIGDAGSLREGVCSCGRGLALMSVEGNARDMLRTASGRMVSGGFFPHMLKEVPEVLEYQAEQRSLEHIILRLVLSAELSERSRRLVESEIRKVFGEGTRVEIVRVDSIARYPSGKRRVTVGLEQRD
jgi:phenylacetate-CoA ligase